MLTFLATFVLFLLAIAGMAVGVLLGRRPIAGSCGGLNNGDGGCASCARPCSKHRQHDATTHTDSQQSDTRQVHFRR